MRSYNVSAMESHMGMYTGGWKPVCDGVKAAGPRAALRAAAPITKEYDSTQEKPKATRPAAGKAIYEYGECKYAVTTV